MSSIQWEQLQKLRKARGRGRGRESRAKRMKGKRRWRTFSRRELLVFLISNPFSFPPLFPNSTLSFFSLVFLFRFFHSLSPSLSTPILCLPHEMMIFIKKDPSSEWWLYSLSVISSLIGSLSHHPPLTHSLSFSPSLFPLNCTIALNVLPR